MLKSESSIQSVAYKLQCCDEQKAAKVPPGFEPGMLDSKSRLMPLQHGTSL